MSLTDGLALHIAQQGLWLMVLLAGPPLVLGLGVGLLVGILQATTQVNEQTLSFVPKLAVLLGALALLGPWMLTTLVDFTRHLWTSLPAWV
jgi:flagellar biosynthetic protein FliQ